MKTYTLNGGERRNYKRVWYLIAALILVSGYLYWALSRPLVIEPIVNNDALQTQAPAGQLAWPAQGQAAVGVAGTSILDTKGAEKPVPTASTAKMITALTVLEKKPLRLGEQGPTITLTANDVALYRTTIAQDGSNVPVLAGERISEYQMLQAIMLPSANNMADSLAIWAFGSLKTYSAAANQYLASHSIKATHVGVDASGLSPTTTSTASDLVRIGELSMRHPVLAEIVGQSKAGGIPVANEITNVNNLLGKDGIVGIKTGNSDQAGGAFVSASHKTINDKQVTIVTSVIGARDRGQAMADSLNLIRSAQNNFKPVAVTQKGSVVGHYELPWGGRINAVAKDGLDIHAWSGRTVYAQGKLQDVTIGQNYDTVGRIVLPESATVNQRSVDVSLESKPAPPSIWWRLTHPV